MPVITIPAALASRQYGAGVHSYGDVHGSRFCTAHTGTEARREART